MRMAPCLHAPCHPWASRKTSHNLCISRASRYSWVVHSEPARGDGLLVIGELLDGRYRIEAKIGAGGMGTVYRGVREQLGKLVAIKTLELEIKESEREELVARFAREAQATAAIRHENVVEIIDFGQTRACVYFVMELLEGYVLADVIGRGRSLEPARLVALAMQSARGFHAAHELGIVHRDVKPSNIFISPTRTGEERVTVLDFGLAKVSDGLKLTRVGMVFGTPSYMSPEQARGAPLDARTDIYSLGCVLFEGLAGRPPFTGESFMEIVSQHLHQPPPRLAELRPELEHPSDLEEVIRCALAKDPDQRFSTMEALERALASLELPAPPPVEFVDRTRVTAAAVAKPKLAERHPVLALLAFLYISQSHSTDEVLAASELQRIGRELHAWKPMTSLRQIRGLVAFVKQEYEALGSRAARRQRTLAVIADLRAKLSEEQRRHALASMWKIAGADGDIIDAERRFISMTVERFNADEFDEPEEMTQHMLPVFADPAEKEKEPEPEDRTEKIAPVFEPAAVAEPVEAEPHEPTQFVSPVFDEPTGPVPVPVVQEQPAPVEPPPLTLGPAPLLEQLPAVAEAFEPTLSGAEPALREPFERAQTALDEMLARAQPLAILRDGAQVRWRDAVVTLRAEEGAFELLYAWLEDGERSAEQRRAAALLALEIGGRQASEHLLALAERSADELDILGFVLTALELGGGSKRDELLLRACEGASDPALGTWLAALERRGIDPGAALIERALKSEELDARATGLRLLCGHAEREAHRYAVEAELFASDPAVRSAALLAGLVLELPQAKLLCAQVARLPGVAAPTYLHALVGPDAQLEVLIELAKQEHAPPAVDFALAGCGRPRALQAVLERAEQLSEQALAGVRLSTGFSGSVEQLSEWWAANAESFTDDTRYLLGQPISAQRLVEASRRVDAQQWPWLRLELLVRSKGQLRLPLRGLPDAMLEALKSLSAAALAL